MITDKFIDQYQESFSMKERKKVIEFFITFSRFECALKATIDFASGGQSYVKPNWDGFVRSINHSFDEKISDELKNAVDFLISFPPKIQILSDGVISWRTREFQTGTTKIKKLSLHIRDVRNNFISWWKIL